MSKLVTLNSDSETIEKLEKIQEKIKKSKSQLFRDMVAYFYERREQLTNGLRIGDVN
jgi:predicted transcriptional regulator